MGRAKDIRIKPISSSDANRIIRRLHYSGKIVQNSKLHLGVFLDGKCGGALQFGPSLDKRKTLGLVEGTSWNGMLELNRMALADWLPRNGESRAISQAMRFIRKRYAHIEWVLSYSDGTLCGDGTIYRASGFKLIGITKNKNTVALSGWRCLERYNAPLSASPRCQGSHAAERRSRASGRARRLGFDASLYRGGVGAREGLPASLYLLLEQSRRRAAHRSGLAILRHCGARSRNV